VPRDVEGHYLAILAINFHKIEVRHDEFFSIEQGLSNVLRIGPDNRARANIEPSGVAGQPGLSEGDEPRPRLRRLLDQPSWLVCLSKRGRLGYRHAHELQFTPDVSLSSFLAEFFAARTFLWPTPCCTTVY
jgi:hypothetical protein